MTLSCGGDLSDRYAGGCDNTTIYILGLHLYYTRKIGGGRTVSIAYGFLTGLSVQVRFRQV